MSTAGVHVSRILTSSHRFSRFLIDSHEFSRVLSISHEFSLFLALSRYEILRRNHDGSAARSNRAGFGARLHQLPGQAGTATAFRVIPSYYELFRVQKPDRGTSRPAACPNAKGARLYTKIAARWKISPPDVPTIYGAALHTALRLQKIENENR